MGFRLVDRILELEALKRIVALKEIKADEDYFPDHFPGYPVMPGVLQVESMAQAAGKCLMAGIDASKWPVLIQVRQANFRKTVPPGSLLRIEAEIQSVTQGTAIANARIRCEEQPVSDATLVFGFVKKGLLLAGYQDEVLQTYLDTAGARP